MPELLAARLPAFIHAAVRDAVLAALEFASLPPEALGAARRALLTQ